MSSEFQRLSDEWIAESVREKYSYNFTWMGRPIIQYPQDLIALQELIWKIRPEIVIETGIAHGGSLVFNASMMQLVSGRGRVIGIDIDIRAHNRAALDEHPMRPHIELVEGSSIDPDVVAEVRGSVGESAPVMVILDSMHTHDHVLEELRAYSPLVQAGSYLVVLDTVVNNLPAELYPDRPWSPTDNPLTAVRAFLAETDRFEIDHDMEKRLAITTAPSGFLRCTRD